MADDSILSGPGQALDNTRTVLSETGAGLLATFQVPSKLCVWLASGSLVIAFCTSLICIGIWINLVLNPAGKSAGDPPVATGDKNDLQKQAIFLGAELYRQRLQSEQRTTALQGCMQLAGVALMFLAVALFLIALGRTRKSSGPAPSSFWEWEITVAGIAALICATLMFIYSSPQSGSTKQPGDAAYPYGIPVAQPPVFGVS